MRSITLPSGKATPELCFLRALFRPNTRNPPNGAMIVQNNVMKNRWSCTSVNLNSWPKMLWLCITSNYSPWASFTFVLSKGRKDMPTGWTLIHSIWAIYCMHIKYTPNEHKIPTICPFKEFSGLSSSKGIPPGISRLIQKLLDWYTATIMTV